MKLISPILVIAFFISLIVPPDLQAQTADLAGLPAPGRMLGLSKPYMPVMIKGILVHPQHPFKFDFLVDSGNTGLKTDTLKPESMKLIKYFMAAMTVPEEEMWVNLSPYEKNRVAGRSLGQTQMGRDLLAQDYILKQLTASLTYPEKEMGKKFWDTVYAEARSKFGVSDIPVNTFNKVWILPEKAKVYEHNNGAFVVESKLKVMLEGDYLALSRHAERSEASHSLASQVVREIIIPALEREVNEGAHFANLRQIYQAMILATWYKIRMKESILGKLYVDQHKTSGITLDDKQAIERIYQQYLLAFKKGVYNYIKDDIDLSTQKAVPRKYVSGGFTTAGLAGKEEIDRSLAAAKALRFEGNLAMVSSEVKSEPSPASPDRAMLTQEQLDRHGLTQEPDFIVDRGSGEWMIVLETVDRDAIETEIEIESNGRISYVNLKKHGHRVRYIHLDPKQRNDRDLQVLKKLDAILRDISTPRSELAMFWMLAKEKFDNAAKFDFASPRELPRVVTDELLAVTHLWYPEITVEVPVKRGILIPVDFRGHSMNLVVNDTGDFLGVTASSAYKKALVNQHNRTGVLGELRNNILVTLLRAESFDAALKSRFERIWRQWRRMYRFQGLSNWRVILGLYKVMAAQMPNGNIEIVLNPPKGLKEFIKPELFKGSIRQIHHAIEDKVKRTPAQEMRALMPEVYDYMNQMLLDPASSFQLEFFPIEKGIRIVVNILAPGKDAAMHAQELSRRGFSQTVFGGGLAAAGVPGTVLGQDKTRLPSFSNIPSERVYVFYNDRTLLRRIEQVKQIMKKNNIDDPMAIVKGLLKSDEKDPYARFLAAAAKEDKDSAYEAMLEVSSFKDENHNVPKGDKKQMLVNAFAFEILQAWFYKDRTLPAIFFKNMFVVTGIDGLDGGYAKRLDKTLSYALLYFPYVLGIDKTERNVLKYEIEQIYVNNNLPRSTIDAFSFDADLIASSKSPELIEDIKPLWPRLIKRFNDSPADTPVWDIIEGVLGKSPGKRADSGRAGAMDAAMVAEDFWRKDEAGQERELRQMSLDKLEGFSSKLEMDKETLKKDLEREKENLDALWVRFDSLNSPQELGKIRNEMKAVIGRIDGIFQGMDSINKALKRIADDIKERKSRVHSLMVSSIRGGSIQGEPQAEVSEQRGAGFIRLKPATQTLISNNASFAVLYALKIEMESIRPTTQPIENALNRINGAIKDRFPQLADLDRAAITEMQKPGGIDLNSKNLDLQIKRDEKGMPLPMQFQNLDTVHIDGLYPVIINISPVTNLPLLLGLQRDPSVFREARSI